MKQEKVIKRSITLRPDQFLEICQYVNPSRKGGLSGWMQEAADHLLKLERDRARRAAPPSGDPQLTEKAS